MALTTRRRALGTLAAATVAAAVSPAVLLGGEAAPVAEAHSAKKRGPRPHSRAHAHNDYEHDRPLLDALDHRFGSFEADVFLVDGALLVAHTEADLDPARTLESLYLDPLRERVRRNHGHVYAGHREPVQLLVDLKTEGVATYAALDRSLRRYPELFTSVRHGRVRERAVTVVVSGDRAARAPMEAQSERRAFYDGRLSDLGTAAGADLIPLISDNWTQNFTWIGLGPFPADQRAKLHDIVGRAHSRDQKVRFWATPDLAGPWRDAMWSELFAAGVDFLNTDDLAGLAAFLDAHGA